MIEAIIDPRSEKLLRDALRGADRATRQTTEKNIRTAAWFIARSGAAASRPGSMRTKREVVEGKTRDGRKLLGMRVLSQDGPPKVVPIDSRSDPRRVIAALGLAAATWRRLAGKFGKAPKGNKAPQRFGFALFRKARRQVKAKMILYLSYIEKAFPGVANTAIKKGLTSFIRGFDRDWASALKEEKWA